MNKIILSAFAVLFSFQLLAQDYFAGPKIGVAGTSFFTSTPENITPTIGGGFTGGGFFRVHNRYFFFQPELEYRFGTGNLKYSDGLVQKISYSCISVPVLLGLKMPLDKKNTEFFRAYGGGSLGLIFSGVNSVSYPAPSANYVANKDTYGGRFEPFEWSWLVGVGIDIGNVMIDIKYDMIWNNIAPVYTNQNIRLRANTLVLAFSYRFKLDLQKQGGHAPKHSGK